MKSAIWFCILLLHGIIGAIAMIYACIITFGWWWFTGYCIIGFVILVPLWRAWLK